MLFLNFNPISIVPMLLLVTVILTVSGNTSNDNVSFQTAVCPLFIETRQPLPHILEEDHFTLVAEGVHVVTTNELLKCLDLYFCSTFMFNIKYFERIKKTCCFIQNFFLSIKDANVTKSMRTLYALLKK